MRLLYEQAAATPALHVIRGLADDGATQDSPRRLFLCMPVWGDAATRSRNVDLDIETRRPASLLSGQDARDSGGEDLLTLPSPEEKMHALSLEYPAVVVPIDTSESSFNRLSSVRRSLIHVDFLIKRKKHHKRRNTISDGNSKEIAEALTNRKKSGTLVKTEALIHSSCQTDDDLLRTSTTTKTTATKSGNNRSSSGGGILSKRRTEESPSSSGELSSSSSTTTETNVNSKPEGKRSSFYEAMNFSRLGRDWKFLKKSSSSKKEAAAAGDGAAAKNEASRVAESGTCTGGSEKKKRAASLLPISTNSGAMTVAVKLRETSARTAAKKGGGGVEDGQSSSGNWSASSSTRASVDSDQQQSSSAGPSPDMIPHSHSESSLGRDSLFSDNTHHSTDGRSHNGTPAGYTSDVSVALTATTLASSWKQPSQGPQISRSNMNSTSTDPESQSGTITPEACHSDSKSSSSPGTRKVSVGSDPFTNPIDDGDSSVYSVDTDGYYTSMHTDSGLKHGFARFPGEQNGDLAASGDRGSQTSIDTIGNLSLNSFLSQNANDTGTDNCSIASTLTQRSKAPPLPPPRLSSVRTLSPIPSQKESSPPVSGGDVSESDCEVGERLRRKTSISSLRYPSICAVSPEPSDEDSCRVDAEKRASPLSECNPSLPTGGREPPKFAPSTAPLVEHENVDKDASELPARCNMYGMQSARKMAFLNAAIPQADASPRHPQQPVLGSFSSAEGDCVQRTGTCSPIPPNAEVKQSRIPTPVKEDSKNPGQKECHREVEHSSSTSGEIRKEKVEASVTTAEAAHSSKQGGTPSPTCSYPPFYLNRPSSLMSKTRSPFLSYLSRNTSPPKTPTTQSPPSMAKSAGRDSNTKQLSVSTQDCGAQDQSTPEPSSPQSGSPQTSPQTTPPAVPPPPPPLTYSSRVLEQGSTRQPSAINEASSVFAQTPSFGRAGARVTLDAEGKVIYSSNSLGRRRDGYGMANHPPSRQAPPAGIQFPEKCMTLPAGKGPMYGQNQRAYVRLDPAGRAEAYTSSTIPRTRYSTSGPIAHSDAGPLLQYKDGMFTLSSPPSSVTATGGRAQLSASGRSTPQPAASGYLNNTTSGRTTPQPLAMSYGSCQPGRTTPVQRPASISTPYASRTSGSSTPVSSDHNSSSGRTTPLHHFAPISVPTAMSPGRRTPVQPSPREPVGPKWVSGLPPSPPKASPAPSNTASQQRTSPASRPLPQSYLPPMASGRTTPVQQYSPSAEPYGTGNASYLGMHQRRGEPSGAASPVSSWRNTGQMAPAPRGGTVRSSTPIGYHPPQGYYLPENSAAYGAVMRQAQNQQGYNRQVTPGSHLVNGGITPVEMQHHSTNNLYRFPDGVNPNRTGHDRMDGSTPQYSSYIPRAPYQPGQSMVRGPLGQQIAASANTRGVDPRGPTPYYLPPPVANGLHENQAYRQSAPSPHSYATSSSRQPPRSPMSSTHLLAPDHVRSNYGAPPTPQKPFLYGQGPQCPPQPVHNTHVQRSNFDNQPRQGPPGVYIPSPLQNSSPYPSVNHSGGAVEQLYGLRDLRKDGSSPTALSSTSLSSSGSEKSPDSSSSTSITRELAPRRPMSTEDLFAAIHTSKKKHGIRTDTDLAQSPLSSRSNSPLVVTSRPSTPSRGGLAETGFLSPRSSNSRDRRSWSGDIAAARVCSPLERRSLANDRLGPAKPTSLLDFKKLLLQTKTSGSQNSLEKKSAVELLRPGSGGRRSAGSEAAVQSLPTSPVNTPSPVESPSVGVSGSNQQAGWTSTVPLKRGGRSRSSLQHRYDLMYPPILEDCQEEGGAESNRAAAATGNAADSGGSDGGGVVAGSVQTHSAPSSTWV